MKQLRKLWVFIASVLLTLSACGSDSIDDPGRMEVHWVIGGSTCATSEVSTVQVTLYGDDGIQDVVTSPCQMGSVIVESLPPGRYNVQVDGFHSQQTLPTYWGTVQDVPIRSGYTNTAPTVEMAEKPGAMDVTWRFSDGKVCAFAGVDTVEISIWDSHSNKVYANELPCSPSLIAEAEEEHTQPSAVVYDSAKGIVIHGLYSGNYLLKAFAWKDGDESTPAYWTVQNPDIEHATLTDVELVFEPCDGSGVCY